MNRLEAEGESTEALSRVSGIDSKWLQLIIEGSMSPKDWMIKGIANFPPFHHQEETLLELRFKDIHGREGELILKTTSIRNEKAIARRLGDYQPPTCP